MSYSPYAGVGYGLAFELTDEKKAVLVALLQRISPESEEEYADEENYFDDDRVYPLQEKFPNLDIRIIADEVITPHLMVCVKDSVTAIESRQSLAPTCLSQKFEVNEYDMATLEDCRKLFNIESTPIGWHLYQQFL